MPIINRFQSELDFLNISLETDTKAFFQPILFKQCRSPFSQRCVESVRGFIQTVVQLIQNDQRQQAIELLGRLSEVNQTHLGYSRNQPRGKGLGCEIAAKIEQALEDSPVSFTGMLDDLDDCALLIRGFGNDLVSDMMTKLILFELIAYTQVQCRNHQIPMKMFDYRNCQAWCVEDSQFRTIGHVELPFYQEKALIFVPKIFVSSKQHVNYRVLADRAFIPGIKQQALAEPALQFVSMLKSGVKKFFAGKAKKHFGLTSKAGCIKYAHQHPDEYRNFRHGIVRDTDFAVPLSNLEIESVGLEERKFLLEQERNAIESQSLSDLLCSLNQAFEGMLFYPKIDFEKSEIIFEVCARYGFLVSKNIKKVVFHNKLENLSIEASDAGNLHIFILNSEDEDKDTKVLVKSLVSTEMWATYLSISELDQICFDRGKNSWKMNSETYRDVHQMIEILDSRLVELRMVG